MAEKYSIKKLASRVAKLEGKRSAARIGDIREILSILSDMIYFHWFHGDNEGMEEIGDALWENGKHRAERNKSVLILKEKKKGK